MSKWKGNIVNVSAPSTSGIAYTGRANGIWTVDIIGQLKQTGLWALGISPPTAPTISTIAVSNQQVSVAFASPIELNGETITSYTVTCSNGQSVSATSSPIVVSGLINNTSYSFSVTANSASGVSASSTSVTAIPSASTVPDAPTITSVLVSGATSVMISVSAPANNGGAAITSYTAVSSPGNITSTLYQSGSGVITVSGLAQLVTYTFTVYATNAVGNSVNSGNSISITTAATDPYFNNVTILLTGNGANGVNTFVSADIGSRVMTTHRNTQVSTSVKKFGTGSINVNGGYLTNSIQATDSIGLNNNFTVEFWFNSPAAQSAWAGFCGNYQDPSYGQQSSWAIGFDGYGTHINCGVGWGGGNYTATYVPNITWNEWHHLAFVRNGSQFSTYLDGVYIDGFTDSRAITNGNGAYLEVGSYIQGGYTFNGYMDDFRITKGVARYTANFTPPTFAAPTQ